MNDVRDNWRNYTKHPWLFTLEVDRRADTITPTATNMVTGQVKVVGEITSYQQLLNDVIAGHKAREQALANDQEQER